MHDAVSHGPAKCSSFRRLPVSLPGLGAPQSVAAGPWCAPTTLRRAINQGYCQDFVNPPCGRPFPVRSVSFAGIPAAGALSWFVRCCIIESAPYLRFLMTKTRGVGCSWNTVGVRCLGGPCPALCLQRCSSCMRSRAQLLVHLEFQLRAVCPCHFDFPEMRAERVSLRSM